MAGLAYSIELAAPRLSLLARPDQLYGQGIGSNDQAQSLKLSKHFRA